MIARNECNKPHKSKRKLKVVNDFYSLRINNILTDVTFIVEDRKISGHRAILAAGSEYFKTLFTGSLSKDKTEYEIKDVEYHLFEEIINGIYLKHITTDNWMDKIKLVGLIDFFQIKANNIDMLLYDIKIPSESFDEAIIYLSKYYPNGFPPEIIKCLSPSIDLKAFDGSNLSDEIIISLLSSFDLYGRENKQLLINIINKLVKSGRSLDLYKIIKSLCHSDRQDLEASGLISRSDLDKYVPDTSYISQLRVISSDEFR